VPGQVTEIGLRVEAGRTAAQPPPSQYGSTKVPLAWISEAACSITESRPGDTRLARTFAVIAAQLAWVWTTALSAPVVPEV